jgi:hypothetical protein
MAELILRQEDGSTVTIQVEIAGTGVVVNPEDKEEPHGTAL